MNKSVDCTVSIEDLWREFDFEPNKNQLWAIRHLDGPLYLPAGPGSGKTRVLLWRTLIPDLLTRTAGETGLTRATVNGIFRQLPQRVREALLRDPEGFLGIFVATIRSIVADHVANRLECVVAGYVRQDLDEFFPAQVQFAQRELVAAGERGLYDQVQRDSGVESVFITRLRDDERVVVFFKFPPKFLVRLPKLIGNYKPDWGIVRRDDSGVLTLHLVRETKGNVDLDRLQFPQEKRKIVCATKHFGAAAVDYRVVTDETVRWWESRPVEAVQEELRVD